jgi:hypothetical protein
MVLYSLLVDGIVLLVMVLYSLLVDGIVLLVVVLYSLVVDGIVLLVMVLYSLLVDGMVLLVVVLYSMVVDGIVVDGMVLLEISLKFDFTFFLSLFFIIKYILYITNITIIIARLTITEIALSLFNILFILV